MDCLQEIAPNSSPYFPFLPNAGFPRGKASERRETECGGAANAAPPRRLQVRKRAPSAVDLSHRPYPRKVELRTLLGGAEIAPPVLCLIAG